MNLLSQSLQSLESALALSLVRALWQDSLLALAAAATLSGMARCPAAARHTVGMGFLLAMLLVPLAHFVRLAVSGIPADAVVHSGFPAALPVASAATHTSTLPDLSAMLLSAVPPAWLAIAWATGVLLMLVRLAGGAWVLQSLNHQAAVQASERLRALVQAQRHALGIVRPVAVRVLNTIDLPFSSQAWRPVLWLPLLMLTRLAPEHLEALIAHELAHVRRLDWLWNGLQCLIEALLFFHPGVWWLSNRIRSEREHACDDLAAELCGDRIVVAEALASLESLRSPAMPMLALAANGGKLVERVARLVTLQRDSRFSWRAVTAGAVMVGCSGILAISAVVAAEAPASGSTMGTAAKTNTDSSWTRWGWWTRVGNSIELRDKSNGHERDYHAWTDLQGSHHESYRVDGQETAIDDNVRQWIAQSAIPPTPPAAPLLPPAPAAMIPPTSPAPPPPLDQEPAYRSIVDQLQHDQRVIALLGSPIRLDQDCSPCRLDEQSISLHLSASGPKGSARIVAEGRAIDGQWKLTALTL